LIPVIVGTGSVFTVTVIEEEEPEPQLLVPVTVIFPEVEAKFTIILCVPCPETILAPVGTVQV
jgi:hypothetical protein